ncbi:MAG: porin [Pseudomonadota bacterium]
MKKILFATTALAFTAGAAIAAEKPVGSVGGYMFMGAGLSDSNTDNDTEIGILRDGEIHLKWKGSSDNGLTFDGRIELEAFTASDQIDENWGRVSGSFGSVLIGSNDTAADNFGDVGILYGPGARLAYYDGFGVVPTEFSDDAGDALGIRYATPSISGFTAAASYHPNGSTEGANDTGYGFASRGIAGAAKDIYSLAANYSGDFGGFSLGVGADYTAADDNSAREVWSIGAEVGTAGFTLAVHYESNEAANSEDIAIGAQYKTGPWTVAGGYVFSDQGASSDIDSFGGWVTYALSPGVTAAAGIEYGDSGNVDAYNALTYLAINF